jgi:hypothetical protein
MSGVGLHVDARAAACFGPRGASARPSPAYLARAAGNAAAAAIEGIDARVDTNIAAALEPRGAGANPVDARRPLTGDVAGAAMARIAH